MAAANDNVKIDLDIKEFELEMARIFSAITKEDAEEWLDYARNCLELFLLSEGILFGNEDWDWSKDGAYEIAIEDIYYWE